MRCAPRGRFDQQLQPLVRDLVEQQCNRGQIALRARKAAAHPHRAGNAHDWKGLDCRACCFNGIGARNHDQIVGHARQHGSQSL
jgi:hypothetical protein